MGAETSLDKKESSEGKSIGQTNDLTRSKKEIGKPEATGGRVGAICPSSVRHKASPGAGLVCWGFRKDSYVVGVYRCHQVPPLSSSVNPLLLVRTRDRKFPSRKKPSEPNLLAHGWWTPWRVPPNPMVFEKGVLGEKPCATG